VCIYIYKTMLHNTHTYILDAITRGPALVILIKSKCFYHHQLKNIFSITSSSPRLAWIMCLCCFRFSDDSSCWCEPGSGQIESHRNMRLLLLWPHGGATHTLSAGRREQQHTHTSSSAHTLRQEPAVQDHMFSYSNKLVWIH